MLGLFKSNASDFIGLDLSFAAVKLLGLARRGDRSVVTHYSVAPLPASAKGERAPEVVASAVKTAIDRAQTKAKWAGLVVPNSSVITKVLQLDKALNDYDIENLLIDEADKYIPFPIEEVNLDFQVIGPYAANPDLIEVLLVASRTENVKERVLPVEESGLTVKVVDVECYAVQRACQFAYQNTQGFADGQTIAVIDIGSTTTTLNVLRNWSIVFTREEIFGGARLTEAIQQQIGLTYEEAGLAKKKGNLPESYEKYVLDPFKESTVIQVRRALQFFFSAHENSKVDRILLAGGTANIKGLAELVEEQLSIPTSIVNPFHNMDVDKRVDKERLLTDAPALLLTFGVAMRGFYL